MAKKKPPVIVTPSALEEPIAPKAKKEKKPKKPQVVNTKTLKSCTK